MTIAQSGGGRAPAPAAVILAGGRSQRMHGRDKGQIELAGRRLVDRVIERLRPQAARLILSAPHDYGTGLEHIPDWPEAPKGPAGGVWSAHKWLSARYPEAEGFLTAPVDGPFLPADLGERLCAGETSAVASDGVHEHPTFACWKCRDLEAAWPHLLRRPQISLKALAEACGVRRVVWADGRVFLNVNSPEDLEAARRLLCMEAGNARQWAP
ncbi:MAG: molybdenum cofactor guanylyltransferase [Alphaproteobacteria bacterium]